MTAARSARRCGIPGHQRAHRLPVPGQAGHEGGAARGGSPVRPVDRAPTPWTRCATFAAAVGYPLIVEAPRRRRGVGHLPRRRRPGARRRSPARWASTAARRSRSRSSSRGTRRSTTPSRIDGRSAHDFVTHYFPNVLEAMRTRWISPQFITTNRIDIVPDYAEVRELGRRVIAVARDRAPPRPTWSGSSGPRGCKFSEIGCRPPGVGAWDLYCAGNEMDLYHEWAEAIVHGRTSQHAVPAVLGAGIITLRPDRDGRIVGYEGLDEILARASASGSSTATSRRRARPPSRSRPATWPTPGSACATRTSTSCGAMLNMIGERVQVRAG